MLMLAIVFNNIAELCVFPSNSFLLTEIQMKEFLLRRVHYQTWKVLYLVSMISPENKV